MENNNDNKVLNVPHLRFPEFSGEWKKCKLGDLCNVLMCKRILVSQTNTEDGVPFYKIGTIGSTPDAYISKELFDDYKVKYNYPRKGEVMITCAGTVGKCVVYDGEDAYFQDSNIVWIDNPTQYISNGFLFHLLSKVDWRKLNSTTIIRIYNDDLRNLKMSYPRKEEQQKISHLLSLLDERIATQNKIIEDLKKLKSAIIDQLYSAIKGKGYSYRQIFEIVNERNKQLEYSNILSASQEKGMVNREDLNLDIQFERSNINTYKVVRKGDYVIHLRSFQGGYAFSDKIGVCSPAYTILRPNDLLEFRYLSYYFTSQKFIKSLIIVTYGIRDGRSINVEEWLDMKTTIPQKEQQRHIVDTIRNIEKKIENEELYASYLSKQKQYLLRQLFI
ncbi:MULTISPECIES: restriction endonuclease subunit S [Bacteroidaceae]|nr:MULTISPECIES: restriction endonuclease subunit S [Bacteroidaceae]KAB1325075.1 restriction endonuclease subunit S [Bacteroides ovatus]MCY6365722.1 restriction endonuclease subunit S [Bacteroides ovatus]MCZ2725345.1 restriction endonuclease subunit S [Bacteroides caccae]